MLYIGEDIIRFKDLDLNGDFNAKEKLKTLVSEKSFKMFYEETKIEYDYLITITTEEELINFLNFFDKFPLSDNEFIAITRIGISLKRTYEIIEKYNKSNFIDKIYVEQYDKREFVNFEDYTIIYDFLKKFDNLLPQNPTELDIIVNAYDYVKNREYLKELDKSNISKTFSGSILTPYIVCAGFVKQFNCLLKEYKIPCFEYQFKENEKEGHDVSLVYLKDKGIYFFDITKDSYDTKKDNLCNESNYSGFMLPATNFYIGNLMKDNFSKELFKKDKYYDLKKRYSMQEINSNNEENVDIFNERQFQNTDLLNILIDVNLELLTNENFFKYASYGKHQTNYNIYQGLQIMHENFGEDINDAEFFIDTLIRAKRNIDYNRNYFIKAILSRFKNNVQIDLSEAVEFINQKIAKI